jgi:hypothetical protein
MVLRQWGLAGLATVAGLALWLLLAGPEDVLGIDVGDLGMALLVTTAWGALYALHRQPRGELDAVISPGEWQAWIGLVFMAQTIGYLLLKSDAFLGPQLPHNPDASAVGRNVGMLLVAWAVIASVMRDRWQGQVQEDERDREIEARASGWGRGALTFCIIGLAVMFGFSPLERLQWATPLMIGNLLVFALLWGCLVEYAAAALMYWRDRR